MRTPVLLTVLAAAVACSRREQPHPVSSARAPVVERASDAFMLRVPIAGGVPRVSAFPALDSTVWTATNAAPALSRVLAFDADAGTIAAVDARSVVHWIDLHAGTVTTAERDRLRVADASGGALVYGVGADGAVARLTPAGNALYHFPLPARAVFPQASGTALVLAGRGSAERAWLVRMPGQTRGDSLVLPKVDGGYAAPTGDPVYLTAGHKLLGVRTRPLKALAPIGLDYAVLSMAATPSGDRFYVVTDSSRALLVVSRYENRVTTRIPLPGNARDLRVDPFGRWVLVRPARGDSIWCVGIGTDRVEATLHSGWRADLPLVAPDGQVALLDGRDVRFVHPRDGSESQRVTDGASEFWYAFVWEGFRPRAAGLDQPVTFGADSDTTQRAAADSASAVPPPPAAVDSSKLGFFVSFAALLSEPAARQRAATIVVNGQTAHVTTESVGGTPVYHVVLGPFATRADADAVGRASGRAYDVYAANP